MPENVASAALLVVILAGIGAIEALLIRLMR